MTDKTMARDIARSLHLLLDTNESRQVRVTVTDGCATLNMPVSTLLMVLARAQAQ